MRGGAPLPGVARVLAAHVTGARPAVAAVFDRFCQPAAEPEYLDFKMIALGAPDDAAALARAFAHAEAAGFLPDLAAELDGLGLLDLSGAAAALGATGRLALLPQDASGRHLAPQAWVEGMTVWADMATATRGLLRALRRVCSVWIDGQCLGTGFLVGPQTVLTNWHVVCDLQDPATGTAIRGSEARLHCLFDHVRLASEIAHRAVPDWVVDFSPMAPGPRPQGGTYPDMTALRPGLLDFCAIRLEGAPGRQRGWFDLSRAAGLAGAKQPFFVVQHPDRNQQSVALSQHTVFDPPGGPFIAHLAATLPGSSGGLCLNQDMQPVALHQGEVTQGGAFLHNRAIWLRAIHQAAAQLDAVEPIHDRVWRTRSGQKAILGRTAIQRHLFAAEQGDAPPIGVVSGPRASGKTFTLDLLEACCAEGRHIFVRLEVEDIGTDARALAEEILRRAGVEPAVATAMPRPQDAASTEAAWIAGDLMRAFRQALGAHLGAGGAQALQLWLSIDGIGPRKLPKTGARDFLDALYGQVRSIPGLRILLLGLDGPPPAGDPSTIWYDRLGNPDDIEPAALETLVGSILAERGIALDQAEVAHLSDIARRAAGLVSGRRAGPLLGRLARVLNEVFLPAGQARRP
ncbi:MAG: trypsin-like serine peptidase [Gemmobacter sp.]